MKYPSDTQPAQRAPRRAARTSAQGSPTAITIPAATASGQYQPVYALRSASSRVNLALTQASAPDPIAVAARFSARERGAVGRRLRMRSRGVTARVR
jgi:hypothetical protein